MLSRPAQQHSPQQGAIPPLGALCCTDILFRYLPFPPDHLQDPGPGFPKEKRHSSQERKTLRLLNALNSEDRGLKVRFSLATIAFDRESAQMSQILSSQGKNAPSNAYPHYLVRLAASRKAHKHKQISSRPGGGGGLPTGGQGSKVYVLCAEPKEHKRFRPGAWPGGIGFPAGRIGDRGDREIVYVPNVYVPFPAAIFPTVSAAVPPALPPAPRVSSAVSVAVSAAVLGNPGPGVL